jgi:hypothetical protein
MKKINDSVNPSGENMKRSDTESHWITLSADFILAMVRIS